MAIPVAAEDAFHLVDPVDYAERGYPHEVWRRLRAEDPVHWWDRTEGVPFWAITKHADITELSRQPEKFLNGPRLFISHQPEQPGGDWFPDTLINLDPPKHGIYRELVSRRFTPRALLEIHDDVDRIGREIVDELVAERDSGECDFVDAVAAPLPIAVIAWLLGLPREDWRQLYHWTNRVLGSGDPEFQKQGEDQTTTAQNALREVFEYFTKLIEERTKRPKDDLVSVFTQARVDGKPLPPIDVLAWCFIILSAGNETTRNATSGGILAFAEHPGELRRLQQRPELLDAAVEEVVRWTSPVIHMGRTAAVDYELRGKTIRQGDALALFYPSANRDEEIFDEPFRFRIDRRPNRHIGFGVGEHFCLGAHVARLELKVAYKHLLPRIEEIELAGPVSRLRSSMVGGIKHLPIRYRIRRS